MQAEQSRAEVVCQPAGDSGTASSLHSLIGERPLAPEDGMLRERKDRLLKNLMGDSDMLGLQLCCMLIQGLVQITAKNGTFEIIYNG